MYSPDSSITGGAQTNMTSPTYGIELDSAPESNGRAHAVTSKGGTQADTRVHTASDPFSVLMTKPKAMKLLGVPSAVTGKYGAFPKNDYVLNIRKGVKVAADAPTQVMQIRVSFSIPAGSESYDAANIRAAVSFLVGLLNEESADIGDTLVAGILP
jgi:hypothetical protein